MSHSLDAARSALPVSAAAQYLGLSVSTLNKKRLTGDGPQFFRLGRRVVYRQIELDQWLESHRRFSTSVAA
ncbi:helix-turn-helix domain-containing protein [Mesorhizobium sp. GR13]|mgnify:CR=1 FL=1|uniref:helix-turn-helix transcriptional regulator n=1 Tax=Mesorhizobium sp. GR13 TaxID=2562308 RepID=UPI0010C058B3|nr:helix-turn-helix domain-containing protein [Mesorhizobium sp. GR13]